MSLNNLYPLWRKELILQTQRDLSLSEQRLKDFQDQTSIYARSIAAMADMRRKALAVYEDSPKALGEKPC